METKNSFEYIDELDDNGQFEVVKNHNSGGSRLINRTPKHVSLVTQQFLQKHDDSRRSFTFTYKAARFEEGWLLDSLGYFYEQKWISDVLRKIKAGKEASVYLCTSGEQVDAPLVAVKVYRPRMLRNLRDDHLYREGRIDLDEEGHQLHDDRSIRAIITRTRYGDEVRHQSWIAYEFTTMQALFEAGADIPQPYEMAHNAILMGYVGDLTMPAPALNEVVLDREEAGQVFERVLHNLDLMLKHERVHGDLSAYNILYWDGDISLIDFPQVVSPHGNRNAYTIFHRDVTRLCEYFIKQGLSIHPGRIAADLWTSHGYHIRPEVHPRLLDADNPNDRKFWKQNEKAK